MLVLDGFKPVNDTWGHQAGDAMLRLVGDTLCQHTRRADIVGRYGGDEFMVILPDTDAAEAHALLTRLREAICAITLPDLPITGPLIGVSIGCAVYPDDATNAIALIAQADRELYAMKEAGKARRAAPSGLLAGRMP